MTSRDTSEACRGWIASVLRGEGGADLPATEDVVVATAKDEGVAPLLLDALADSPPAVRDAAAALTPRLVAVMRDQVAVEMLRAIEARRVTDALLGAGVPFLVLKGAALAYRVYERPHHRPRCDLDLLMPAVTVVESARPLLESLGYEASSVQIDTLMTNETPFRRQAPGGKVHWIDAHWALTNNALFGTRFGYDELLRESVALPGFAPDARGLGDVHALIHACLHRVANMPHSMGDRLIWLYDILLLAKRLPPGDWERLAELAADRGVAGPVLGGLEAAGRWLSCPQPVHVLQLLRQAAMNERFDMRRAHRRSHLEWHNFLSIPRRLRARWMWKNLFPSPAYIEAWRDDRGPVAAADYWRRLRRITGFFRD